MLAATAFVATATTATTACITDATPPVTGGSGSSSGDPDPSASSAETTSAVDDGGTSTSADPTEDTTGTAMCGNGRVETGEECDEQSPACNDDCSFVCGVDSTHVADVLDASRILFSTPPRAIEDGTGDLMIAVSRGASRIDDAGDNVWIRTSWPGTWTTGLVLAGDGTLWRIGETTPGSFLGRYDTTTGDQIFSTPLPPGPGGPDSLARGLALAPDGGVLTQRMVFTDAMTRVVRVERFSPDGSMVEWTTDLVGPPSANGFSIDAGHGLVVSPEGEIFSLGRDYLDFDTDEPLVVKLDADGNQLWREVFYGGDIDTNSSAPAGTAIDDGGFVALGFRQLPGAHTVGIIPEINQSIARFDDGGGITWEVDPATFSKEGHVQLNTIDQLPDGVLAFAGTILYEDTGDAVFGYIDVADGSLLCMSNVFHRSAPLNLGESLFVGADGTLMMIMGVDDLQPDNNLTEGRWIAALRPLQ